MRTAGESADGAAEPVGGARESAARRAFTRHVAWTSDEPIGLEIARAEGHLLITADGRTFSDLISGIAVSAIGHRHPAVLQAVREQLDRHLHVMVYGEMVQAPQALFARALTGALPDGLDRVYFTMTGTEANEGALKLARKYTGRTRFVAFDRSYHGDTFGSLSVTGRQVYRAPYEPLLDGVTFLPYDDRSTIDEIDEEVAGVIVEPIQGEGGIRVPDNRWLLALRARCSEVGALLIFDEIQTGFGRTGHLFAFQHSTVVPDVLTLAKAMGGGMPLGAFVSSDRIFSTFRRDPPLSHVTTFGGHPVSCAAAAAAFDVMCTERLWERAPEIERRVRAALSDAPGVEEIRGRGAMLGLELGSDSLTRRFVAACLERGLLLGWTLHSSRLVRFAPPLNIPLEALDAALMEMHRVLSGLDVSADEGPDVARDRGSAGARDADPHNSSSGR